MNIAASGSLAASFPATNLNPLSRAPQPLKSPPPSSISLPLNPHSFVRITTTNSPSLSPTPPLSRPHLQPRFRNSFVHIPFVHFTTLISFSHSAGGLVATLLLSRRRSVLKPTRCPATATTVVLVFVVPGLWNHCIKGGIGTLRRQILLSFRSNFSQKTVHFRIACRLPMRGRAGCHVPSQLVHSPRFPLPSLRLPFVDCGVYVPSHHPDRVRTHLFQEIPDH